MRYTGLTYESTAQGLSEMMDKLSALSDQTTLLKEMSKQKEDKVDKAVDSIVNDGPAEGKKPNPDGVKESGCGKRTHKPITNLKQASYVLDDLLKKKLQIK